jgi:hypothetical protein
MLLCRVRVGRSLVRTAAEALAMREAAVPDGYGSVYVPGRTSAADGFSDTYHVYERARCVPLMVVEFELLEPRAAVDPRAPDAVNDCVVCSYGQGVVECADCGGPLCLQCNQNVHLDLSRAKHTRIPLRVVKEGDHCEVHDGVPLDRFCTLCGVPACVQCKVEGGHQGREHEFVTLDVVYEELADAIAGMEARREHLAALSTDADRHCDELAELATRKAAAYRQHLSDTLQSYLVAMRLADERRFEIERCIADIERAGDYLEFQQRTTSRVRFLSVWNYYRRLTGGIAERVEAIERAAPDGFAAAALDARDQEIRQLRALLAERDRTIAELRESRAGSALGPESRVLDASGHHGNSSNFNIINNNNNNTNNNNNSSFNNTNNNSSVLNASKGAVHGSPGIAGGKPGPSAMAAMVKSALFVPAGSPRRRSSFKQN